jgi:hypothetical protein
MPRVRDFPGHGNRAALMGGCEGIRSAGSDGSLGGVSMLRGWSEAGELFASMLRKGELRLDEDHQGFG